MERNSMSEYHKQTTEFTDADSLFETLKEMGFKNVEMHATERHLVGYMNDQRPETATVIIPRCDVGGMSNEIGFHKNPATGKFEAIISAYDSHRYNQKWLTNLKVNYQVKHCTKYLQSRGIRDVQVKKENGKIKMYAVQLGGN
jgi:hypothetical protein